MGPGSLATRRSGRPDPRTPMTSNRRQLITRPTPPPSRLLPGTADRPGCAEGRTRRSAQADLQMTRRGVGKRTGPTSPSRQPRPPALSGPVPRQRRGTSPGCRLPDPQPSRDEDARRPCRFSFCRAAFRRDSSRRCFTTCSGWLAPQRSGSKASRSVSSALNRSSTSRT